MIDIALLIVVLSVAGLAAGVMAGLLGVGGGIIMVPVLFQTFIFLDVPEAIQMHLAVGTSLAIIVVTSLQSVRAHAKLGSVDIETIKLWALPIIIGAASGALIARMVSADGLKGLFALLALTLGIRILLMPQNAELVERKLPRLLEILGAGLIGFLSALMGIGGGTFSVPFMALLGKSMHKSVGTSAGIGFFIALPAALGFAWAGYGSEGLPPYSVGFVNALAFLIMIPTTLYGAPYGARLAHRLEKRKLQIIFACFLFLMGARMLYALLT